MNFSKNNIWNPISLSKVIEVGHYQEVVISVVTIVLMLMHVGCRTMKCGSTTCRNYDGTCDGGRILEKEYKLVNKIILQIF